MNLCRKFKDYNSGNLAHCYRMIKGLMKTCQFYDKCGPRTSAACTAYYCFVLSDMREFQVCSSPTGDYYKEPEVQRMCGICQMARTELLNAQEVDDNGGGCLADDAVTVRLRERDGEVIEEQVDIRDLAVGDLVRAPDASGQSSWRPVYYMMAHKETMPLVELQWRGGSLTVSNNHFVPRVQVLRNHGDAPTTARASEISVGDSIFVLDGREYKPAAITGVGISRGMARYVLVEGGRIEVGARHGKVGAAATVYSTSLGEFEALPFRFLHTIAPGSLQVPAIARSLELALDSPLLMTMEGALVSLERMLLGRQKVKLAHGEEHERARRAFMTYSSSSSSSSSSAVAAPATMHHSS
eukprot:762521-Hanusia_phi.AAC.5